MKENVCLECLHGEFSFLGILGELVLVDAEEVAVAMELGLGAAIISGRPLRISSWSSYGTILFSVYDESLCVSWCTAATKGKPCVSANLTLFAFLRGGFGLMLDFSWWRLKFGRERLFRRGMEWPSLCKLLSKSRQVKSAEGLTLSLVSS